MFVLFDEEKTIFEFAKRGIGISKSTTPTEDRLPMVGWHCPRCLNNVKLAKTDEGHCLRCLEVNLKPIFGEASFFQYERERKQRLKEINRGLV